MRIYETDCPVCNSTEYYFLFRDINRRDNIDCSGRYVQCGDCSLVYLRDRPLWEEVVRLYSVLDQGITANLGKVDVATLKTQVEKSIPKWKQLLRKVRFRPHSWPLEPVLQGSKRLLDLGCGSGAKLFEFAERGYDVWGLDVSTDAIKVCQKLLPQGHFIEGELQKANLPGSYFDYIRIDNVLEHVPNPKEVVNECYRLLKKNGKLLIYVPHGRSFSMRFLKGNSISSWIPFHLQLFTRKSLKRLLDESGFNPQISQITRINSICIYEYNPTSWLPLSIMQWRNQSQPVAEYSHPRWLTWACYPIGWVATKVRIGEELVGIGIKFR